MKTKTILLIEDDQLDVSIVKRALAKLPAKAELRIAQNGVEALAVLNGSEPAIPKLIPDIILLDINMPEMSGLEFLGIIKNYYSLKKIKVFVMISSAEEYDIVAAQRFGVTGYILKPLDFDPRKTDRFSAGIALLRGELLGKGHKGILPIFVLGTRMQSFKTGKGISTFSSWSAGTKVVAAGITACGIVGTLSTLQKREQPQSAKQVMYAPKILVFESAKPAFMDTALTADKKPLVPAGPRRHFKKRQPDTNAKVPVQPLSKSLRIIAQPIEEEAYEDEQVENQAEENLPPNGYWEFRY